ncbi:MAG: [FeFe] hydrogenase H-cluster maturation GTPase HydF [Lachnospiraceae bacterium]|nr:[FeFe] hydrogenase H-cluster maturation GTPase HydF [Lachnospiraceae bacterium]
MGLNETPSGERIHVGFFGRRNAGKSSLVNAVTNQDIAVVSDVKGTTTDPVIKSMELLPLGPVVIIDTPGFDDEGSLGELRVKKTKQILNKTDIAVLVVDATAKIGECEKELISIFKDKNVPYIIAYNKADLTPGEKVEAKNEILVSAEKKTGITELKDLIGELFGNEKNERVLVGDLVNPGDFVVLVIPIDKAAPKGRLILPQQQVIRDLLDHGISTVVVRESELKDTLDKMGVKPKLVITDSQVFAEVSKVVPEDIYLTSFSILMARYKGFLETAIEGVKAIDDLKPGDKVLISEGCTHHRQCGDIGTFKIPNWIKQYKGFDVPFDTSSGGGFPEDLSEYKLIIHCGGCMLNEREMVYRMKCAIDAGVPFTNYGIIIAKMKGILDRSIAVIK